MKKDKIKVFVFDELLDENVLKKLKIKYDLYDYAYCEGNLYRISFKIRYPMSYTWSRYVLLPHDMRINKRKSTKKVYGMIIEIDKNLFDLLCAYEGSSKLIIGKNIKQDLVYILKIKVHTPDEEVEAYTFVANMNNPEVKNQCELHARKVRGKDILFFNGLKNQIERRFQYELERFRTKE